MVPNLNGQVILTWDQRLKFANTIALRLKGLGNISNDSVNLVLFVKYGFLGHSL